MEPERRDYDGRIYANFNPETNPMVRGKAWEWARHCDLAVTDEPESTERGRIRYLRKLRAFNFVLCPQGNGADTVRCWETLYMGGFPVMERHPYLEATCDSLPVCWVDSWAQLEDESFKRSEWERLSEFQPSLERLRLDYWVRRFTEEADRAE